ncbi:MAG TPA: PRC-barrel domain-containing protein [Promineifilum sp.]
MRLGKELLNKPIYTIDEGRMIGKVQDLFIDDSLEVVLGVFLGSQGLVRRKSQLIRSGDIVIYGVDAVLVANGGVITDDSALPAAKEWLRREKLIGREADTPGGTRLGVLGDVTVDATGRITGFAMSRVYVEGPLSEKRFVARSVVLDTGSQDGRMTVDLARLEASLVNAESVPAEVEAEDVPAAGEPMIIVEDKVAPDSEA